MQKNFLARLGEVAQEMNSEQSTPSFIGAEWVGRKPASDHGPVGH